MDGSSGSAPPTSAERQRLVALLLKEGGITVSRSSAIPRRSVKTPLPLSFAQQRLWFLEQLAPGTSAYNIPLAVRLEGDLDVAALERALNRVVSRHESLRTTFSLSEGGEPRQHVAAGLRLALPVIDLRGEPERVRREAARRLIMEVADEPFDLSRGPLLRARLLRLGAGEHAAALALHHAVADGWSLGVLMRELGHYYGRYSGGGGGVGEELGELVVQYGDYAEWQRGRLRGEALAAEVGYWRGRLEGMATLEVPTDRARPAAQSFRGAYQVWKLPLSETERIVALCNREGVTMFMTLMTAFQILLHYLTGQVDIVVGTDIANRNHRQIEGLIGFFVNQLVLRLDLSGDPTFRELLEQARATTLEAYAHQEVPFEMLVAEMRPERELSRTPMFQVKLVLQNYPLDDLELPGLTLTPIPIPVQTSKYDLLFNIHETKQGLAATLEYDTDLFDAATISRFLSHYEAILRQAVEDPEVKLKALVGRLARADEQRQAVKEDRLAEVSVRKLRGVKRRPITGP